MYDPNTLHEVIVDDILARFDPTDDNGIIRLYYYDDLCEASIPSEGSELREKILSAVAAYLATYEGERSTTTKLTIM